MSKRAWMDELLAGYDTADILQAEGRDGATEDIEAKVRGLMRLLNIVQHPDWQHYLEWRRADEALAREVLEAKECDPFKMGKTLGRLQEIRWIRMQPAAINKEIERLNKKLAARQGAKHG